MESKKRVNLVGPTILIVVGIVLLLNNMGWTAVSVWDLLRLWPILLVAAGLELLIGQRSRLGSVLVLVVMLALLAGGLWLLSSSGSAVGPGGEQIGFPLEGSAWAEADIGFGVGTLRIGSVADSGNLLEGTVELHRGERLERDAKVTGDTMSVRLRSRSDWPVPFFGWEGDKAWDLRLNREVPLKLEVDAGVGDVHVDLRRMNLSAFKLNTGVGRTVVVLPEDGRIEAKISGGVGDLVVQVPDGTEIRVRATTGLGQVSVPSAYGRQGERYVSPGYERAENRIDLTVENGIGRILIQAYAGE